MKTDIERAFQALITEGWANGSAGAVDEPGGHVAIIDMSTERAMMAQVLAETEDEPERVVEVIRPGWYVVTEDSSGNVHVHGPLSEAEAQSALAKAEQASADYHDGEEA